MTGRHLHHKMPPMSALVKKAGVWRKGIRRSNRHYRPARLRAAGEDVAKQKMPDLNANSLGRRRRRWPARRRMGPPPVD